jgi:ubiquinone/menaquinone biosynthesis C-methylase UbiE
LFKALLHKLLKPVDTAPEPAYDLWAGGYDSQPDNLMLALDEMLFTDFLQMVDPHNKIIIDVGCGTGRHWKRILDRKPQQLIGYDVSAGMLEVLKKKFPEAITYRLNGNHLSHTADKGVDMLISTLTIAHIEDAGAAMEEWNRVIKPGADIYISDYHPGILQKGGKRTFTLGKKTVSVKNYIHSIEKIKHIAGKLNWQEVAATEKRIDDKLRPFYEKQNALKVYEMYKGMPVIYGIHFKKEK